MSTLRRRLRHLSLPALVALTASLAIACSGAAAPSANPPDSGSGGASPVAPSAGPPDTGGSEPGGGSTGDPGTGIGLPIGPTPLDPGAGQPTLQIPKPGRLDPHPVPPQRLQASVDGRHVLIKISWYSGIAPCSVLDSVNVARTGNAIALTVIEGADQLNTVCAELAMFKATIVDLGELEPGTWTITAPNSDAPPIELTIA